MTTSGADFSIKRIYLLTGIAGLVGFAFYFGMEGARSALAFGLGSLGSLGNLWVFEWLSGSIAPNAATRKPWQAGAFFIRYVLLLGIGYGIVKALNVSPLAVVLGLLTNAAAVLLSLILELISYALHSRTSH